jgi:hypothetical protein
MVRKVARRLNRKQLLVFIVCHQAMTNSALCRRQSRAREAEQSLYAVYVLSTLSAANLVGS